MMALNGNRWMQKREVEKRMQLHWKNLEEKTSTGASFRDENPRKSMLNRRDKIVKQREIHQQNEKLIGKLYEILTSKNRPLSPQRNQVSSDLHEVTKKIQTKGRQLKQEATNKKIGEANLQLLEAITTVQSPHNPSALEKDYISRKRVVEKLRLNSSPTTLHLLAAPPVLSRPKSAPKERPKSAGSLPSWYHSVASKMSGGEKNSSRIHPCSAFSTTASSAYPAVPSPLRSSKSMPDGRDVPSRPFEEKQTDHSPEQPQLEPEQLSQQQQMEQQQEQQQKQQQQSEQMMTSRPRKILLNEIDMRGVVLSPALASPGDNRPVSSHSSQRRPRPPHQSSVPFPHSAVFIVRIYDVGRTFAPLSSPSSSRSRDESQRQSQSFSSGLVVESKLLPETEKSLAYELFLPLKQLKLLVDSQPSPLYESLGRKLRRLKCVNRETGLYTELSNTIPPSFLEQLCDLILRNIETVIEPKTQAEKTAYAAKGTEEEESEELGEGQGEGDAEGEEMKRNYRVRIQLKSAER